jgi:hypothetical protein
MKILNIGSRTRLYMAKDAARSFEDVIGTETPTTTRVGMVVHDEMGLSPNVVGRTQSQNPTADIRDK